MRTGTLKIAIPFLAVLFILPGFCRAQRDSTRLPIEYFHNWNSQITSTFEINNQIDGFEASFGSENEKIKLRPNDKLTANLFLTYRIIVIHVAWKPSFLSWNNDDENRGETKYFKINTRFYLNQFFSEIGYYRTRGYYLANPEDIVSGWQPGDPNPLFPDLVSRNIGGETSYLFNPRFSIRSILDHTEKQLISQGSFIPSLFYHYYQNDDRTELTENSSSQKANNFEMLFNVSHWQTLVFARNFRFSTALGVGVGAVHTKLKTRYYTESYTSKSTVAIYRGQLMGDLCYDNGKVFTGFRAMFQGETYNQSESGDGVINQRHSYLNLYFGLRLTAPPFLRKNYQKMEKLIP